MKSNRKLHPGEEVAEAEDQGPISVEWDEVGGKPSSYPPNTHYHSWEDIFGKPDFLDFMDWKHESMQSGTEYTINREVNEPFIVSLNPVNDIELRVSPDNKSKFFGLRVRDTCNVHLKETATTRFRIGANKMPTVQAGGLVFIAKSPVMIGSNGWVEYLVIGDLLDKGKPTKTINQPTYDLKKEDVGYWLVFVSPCVITYNTYDKDSEFEGESYSPVVSLSFESGDKTLNVEEGLTKELYGGGVFGIKVRSNLSGKLFGSLKPEE